MGDVLDLDRDGDVFVLVWHDGENRFRRESVDAWNEALDTIEQAGPPRALVATGEGKFWSNGLDLDWMATIPDARAFLDDVHRLLVRVLTFPAITVGALNGHAFAAGAMLASALDFRVMRADRGYWCLPEADLGLPLTPLMQAVIEAKLPRVAAHEAIVTGRRYSGQDALAAGIVHELAEVADVVPRALLRAAGLADKRAVDEHKRQLYGHVTALL
ncbi:MAG: enoyl-CoA hydratase/isomerase family protein [Acidimicrobiales bacterium]|nr:enoyl-CoA hydratase/isomerase family protein [Acidimicrobiales bacterium]